MDIIDIIIKACIAFFLLAFVVCLVLTIALVIGEAIKAAREERRRKEGAAREERRRKEVDDLDCD